MTCMVLGMHAYVLECIQLHQYVSGVQATKALTCDDEQDVKDEPPDM